MNKLFTSVFYCPLLFFVVVVVQMKFTMQITTQKLSFDIFMVGNLQNIFMEHDLYLISL